MYYAKLLKILEMTKERIRCLGTVWLDSKEAFDALYNDTYSNFPTGTPTECDGVYLTVTLLADYFGKEVSWNVKNGGETILSYGETYGSNLQYVASTCVPEECDGDYTFSIFDSWGDGMSFGTPGSYLVTLDGVTKAEGGGNYGAEEITEFSCSPTTAPPTPPPTPEPAVPPTNAPTATPAPAVPPTSSQTTAVAGGGKC